MSQNFCKHIVRSIRDTSDIYVPYYMNRQMITLVYAYYLNMKKYNKKKETHKR
jgi:hypothetical protein